MTENVIINLETQYKDKGAGELKKVLSGTRLAMDNLTKSGKTNTDTFRMLQTRTEFLNAKIKDFNKTVTTVSSKSTGGLSQLKTSLEGITSHIPLLSLGLAGASAAIVKFGFDAFKTGADFQELSSNFAGSTQDLELFRKATAGTVSDGGLIQLSNYASDLGVSLKDQALLFSLAEDAADKYGGTVQDNFERVINATDGSAKGLRAIGIGVKEYNQALKDLLPTNVKNIDDLTAEEQQQIRLEAIIKAKGITIDDVKDKQQSNADVIAGLSVLYENFITNVGLAMNENVKLGDSMTILSGKAETLGKAFGNFISEGLDKVSQKMQNDFKDYERLKNLIEDISRVANAFMSLDLEGQLMFLRNGMQWGMINVNDKNPTTDTGPDFPPEVKVDQFGRVITERQPTDNPPPKVKTKSSTNRSNSRGNSALKDKVQKTALELLTEAVNGIARDSKFQNFIFDNLKVNAEVGTIDPLNGGGIDLVNKLLGKSSIEEIKTGTDWNAVLEDSQNVLNNVQSLFGLLNAGTDTFIGKMLSFFNAINSVMQGISLVKSIIGLIGSFATGGATGGAKMASMPSGQSGGGNVYLGLDLNTMQVYKQGRQQFLTKQNQIRIN